ncbi:MAG: iron-sulfur cluster assembly accessory protein [Gloeomargarita sp. HHBFW_bins_162]
MSFNLRLTPAAIGAIHHWQLRTEQEQTYLRLGVAEGGCAGYFYTLDLENPNKISTENDVVTEISGVTVVLRREQQTLLAGLTLDYTEDLVGGSFRFKHPHARQTCSCGHSFSLSAGNESP